MYPKDVSETESEKVARRISAVPGSDVNYTGQCICTSKLWRSFVEASLFRCDNTAECNAVTEVLAKVKRYLKALVG